MRQKRLSSQNQNSCVRLNVLSFLKVIDAKWMDHIDDMEILRQGIGLAAYGQRDPVVNIK